MSPLWIVEHLNIIEHIAPRLFTRSINFAFNTLTLEEPEEALRHRIVVATAMTTHTPDQLMGFQEVLPIVTAELATLI